VLPVGYSQTYQARLLEIKERQEMSANDYGTWYDAFIATPRDKAKEKEAETK
jgi:hypothetical protein